MLCVPIARLTVAVLVLHSISARAEAIEIDLSAALARAHQLAPDAIAARERVAEAEARSVSADLLFTSNPEIEGGIGPRLIAGRPLDAEARLEQNLEIGRRDARRGLARAEVAQAQVSTEVALRALDLEVALAFADAVFAERSEELAHRSEELAHRAAEVAARRRKAGDITDLDANLARAAFARASAATDASAAERASAIGRLAELIGARAGDTIAARGELRSLIAIDTDHDAAMRADVRALAAERDVAIAEGAQATASARPEVGVWVAYQREDRDDIVLGGLRLSLPVWNRAQGETASARVQERRATELREATLRTADRQVADATAAYRAALRAVERFERDVAPILDDSELLLQKTVDAGQLAMSDYLVARQELVTGRREYLDRLLALARAAATLRYVAGGAR